MDTIIDDKATLEHKIRITIGLLKGSLHTYKLNLKELFKEGIYSTPSNQFFHLKLEMMSFLSDIETNIIVPMQELMIQNINSIYHLTMMEMGCRIDVNKFREDIDEINYSDGDDEVNLAKLWKLSRRLADETRIMATIAELRLENLKIEFPTLIFANS